jgi:hypothetical protein
VRTVIDANAESIDELAAQPSGDTAQPERHDFEQEQSCGWCRIGSVSPHQPDHGEDQDDNDVGPTVQQPDPLRASAGGYGKPINQAEYRCEKAADDACGDVPIRNGGEGCRLTPQVQAVEYDGGDEEAEWKDNQHRMNWMPEKFGSAFHPALLSEGISRIDLVAADLARPINVHPAFASKPSAGRVV